MLQNINAVIIDDEDDGRQVLTILLKNFCPNINIQAQFGDAELALQYLIGNKIDVVFLDIEMPRLSGFELLEQIGKVDFKVIFVTAYDKYMLKAIKVAAFDYLIKPVGKSDLVAAIERLQSSIANDIPLNNVSVVSGKIIIPVGNGYEFIDTERIVKCESSDNYTIVCLNDGRKITISKTLKYFEDILPVSIFLRCHSQYIINIAHINKFLRSDGGFFELQNGETVPLSRTKKDIVLKRLGLQ